MLITFKSSASANLTMLDSLARDLFKIIGKSLDTRGILRSEELIHAIQRLEMAIAVAQREQNTPGSEHAESTPHLATQETKHELQSEPLRLAQRAFPLLDMLRAAQQKNADVLWGI